MATWEGNMGNQAFRFTDKAVRELKPTNKREYYHDTIAKDLLLQITPNGAKTFYLYKRMGGKPVRYKLGKVEMGVKSARIEASKYRALVSNGVNPQETRKNIRNEDPVENIYKKYMNDHKMKLAASTYESYQRLWNLHLKKAFGSKKISQVSIDTVRRFHKRLFEKPYCANKCVVFLKAMYNYVIHEGVYKGSNPVLGIELNAEEHRVRYLEHAELERFFDALNEVEETVSRDAILFLLYTGVRKSNALAAKWDEIDLDAKIWLIPKTKTGKNITIALADSAVELLKDIRANNPEAKYVFPSAVSKTGHLVDIKRVWGTVKKKANIKNLHIHDLRHNLATYMIAQGANPFVVQRTLAHKSLKSTQVYVNLGVEHLRDKLNETVNTIRKIGKNKGS